MAMNKEKNFISAVVYLRNDGKAVAPFLAMLKEELEAHFEQYEIVAVDDASTDNTAEEVRRFARENMEKPLTLLHTSIRQDTEKCMNAGQDCAIGDFVYEFDSVQQPYAPGLIFEAYQTALKGSDVVTVSPSRVKAGSKLFYSVLSGKINTVYDLDGILA